MFINLILIGSKASSEAACYGRAFIKTRIHRRVDDGTIPGCDVATIVNRIAYVFDQHEIVDEDVHHSFQILDEYRVVKNNRVPVLLCSIDFNYNKISSKIYGRSDELAVLKWALYRHNLIL